MRSARRTFLQLVASASALPALSRFVAAQVQTGGIAVEEVTIADLHAAYLSGRATACCHAGAS
jgi:hypothetical protein